MTENEKINGWTFEETVKIAENLMEAESNMLKWDILRHLRDFLENYKDELEQYRAIGTVEQLEWCKDASHWKELFKEKLEQYEAIGTIEEFKRAKEMEAVYGQVKWERDVAIGQLEEIGVSLGQKMDEFKALKVTQKMIEKSNFCLEQYRADTDTAYQCGYNKAIDEFAELMKEKLKDMQFAEFQGIDVCPCAKTGEECPYINQDIDCQYCAREQTIKEIEEIAEQLKAGVKNEID